MKSDSKILVTGGSGLIGHALLDLLQQSGYINLTAPDRNSLDLTDANRVYSYFEDTKPDYVFHLAARVGGIKANSEKPAEFIKENLCLQTNVIDAAYRSGVHKLIFMACSCIYPKQAVQPLKVESLFEGKPEPTNEAFAYAKIAGIKMCQAYNKQYGTNYITIIPSNVFGEHDSFSPTDSHVISALIQKVCKAKADNDKAIILWGTGKPKRELLYVKNLVSALIFCMEKQDLPEILNIGSGEEITIEELATTICRIFDYKGNIIFDTDKPDGMMRKVLDSSELKRMGWKAKYGLIDGLKNTVEWYIRHVSDFN